MKDPIIAFVKEHRLEIDRLVADYTPQLNDILKNNGIQAMMDSVYFFIDDAMESSGLNEKTTCSKGCSFCCYTDMKVTSFEASYIKSYVDQCKIPYNKTRVKKQVKGPWEELKYRDKRCPMLDREGLCNIYGVRPMVCRIYNSIDKPSKCNTEGKKSTSHAMLRIVPVYAMMMAVVGLSEGNLTISETLNSEYDGKEKTKNN